MSDFDEDTNRMGVPQLLLHRYQCWHGLYGHQYCDEQCLLFPSSNAPSGIGNKTIHLFNVITKYFKEIKDEGEDIQNRKIEPTFEC